MLAVIRRERVRAGRRRADGSRARGHQGSPGLRRL